MNEPLHKRLQRLRRAKGLTATHVGHALGVAPSTYRDWENGRQIRGEPYAKLSEVLGCSLVELMTGRVPIKSNIFNKLEQIRTLLKEIESDL
jgi:transcriptional regulator with XRE-family HTH domain